MSEQTDLEAFQIKCAEAERALEDCHAALELVPIWALEKGQNWLPSDVALLLLRKAKDSVAVYATHHWHTNTGNI